MAPAPLPSAVVRVAAALVLALCFALRPGLSVAQPMPATRAVPTVPNPSLVDDDAPAAPSTPAPVPSPAPAVVPPASPPAAAEPAQRSADIALVLPLAAPDYARAAEAVRDGFVAAATAAGVDARVRVIGHEDGAVAGAFDAAGKLGVRVVVGPLVRDDLRALAAAGGPLPLTLALNQFDDGSALPPSVYALTLSLDADARLIANRMRDDQVASVAVIRSDSPLERRFVAAFTDAWLAAGGGAPEVYRFDFAPEALGALRRDIAKSNAQAALVTLPGAQAALARSFAPRLPAYATSLVHETLDVAALRDLEGVVFVDVPWLVQPLDPAFAGIARPESGSNVLQRLYALGLDAFAVARLFVRGVPDRLDVAGATGRLTLGDSRLIQRSGALATFRRGQVVPLDGAR